MATNNSINSPLPTTVPNGGTGIASTTAYMPLCGGTSSTGALQSAATGTLGETLIYNTSSSLPSFGGYPSAINQGNYNSGAAYACTGFGYMQGNSVLTTVSLAAGTVVYYFPFFCGATRSFSGLETYIVTGHASSNIAMAIYANQTAGGNLPSGSPLSNSSTGSLSTASSATLVSSTFGTNVPLQGGLLYWIAITASSAAVTFAASAANQDYPNGLAVANAASTLDHIVGFTQAVASYSATLPAFSYSNTYNQITAMPILYILG